MDQSIKDAPSIMTVITAKEIRERGYQSVAEAVRTVPGLSLWVDNLISSISIRGFNSLQGWSQNLKIMIDGQPVSFRVANWNFIDEEMIPIQCVKRIEIIKGPASVLYGANAYLGAINIITFDGVEFDSFDLTMVGGSRDTYGGYLVAGKKIDDIDFMAALSARHSDRSGLSLPAPVPTRYQNTKSDNDLSRPKSFYGKISYKGLTISSNYQQINRYGEFTDWSTLTHDNLIYVDNWFVKAEYEESLLDHRLEGTASLAYGEGEPNKKEHLAINQDYYIRRDIGVRFIDLALKSFYKFTNKNSLGIGIDYTTEDQQLQNNYLVNRETGEETLTGALEPQSRKNFDNFGFFTQAVYYLNPEIGVTAGLRFDFHNLYGDSTSCRVSIIDHISDKLYLKVLYGTSFKAPSQRQLFDPFSGRKNDTKGNKDLTPQYARTFETLLGFKLNENLQGKLGGFYTRIEDGIELCPVSDSGSECGYTYYNTANLKSFGLEGGLNAEFGSDLSGYVNFSYQNTRYNETDENTTFVPQVTANMGLNYVFMKHLNINLENIFVGRRISPKIAPASEYTDPGYRLDEDYKLPSYLLVNLTLSTKQIKIFEKETFFSLSCRDLFNEKYVDPGPSKEGYDIPHHGRTYLITISQKF
jgi:iron complex outermembrane receptor protein